MDEKNILQTALAVYGYDSQREQLGEEMAELTVALSKLRRGKGVLADVAEEIADVRIMLDQIEMFFGIEAMTRQYRTSKLLRLGRSLNIIRDDE